MIRVGVIGLGFGTAVHVPAWRSLEGVEVVALAGTSLSKAQEQADRLKIPKAFASWQDLVADPSIDWISVATPAAVQAAILPEAIKRGKHIFCEKPLGTELISPPMLAEKNTKLCVDFEFPEVAEWQLAHERISQAALGELRHCLVSWHTETYASRMNLQNWKRDASQGGGVLNLFGSHLLFNLEWFFAESEGPIVELSSTLEGSDYASIMARFSSGFLANASMSTNSFSGNGHRWEIYGSDGALVLENKTADYITGFSLRQITREEGIWKNIVSTAVPSSQDGRVSPVAKLMQKFLNGAKVPGLVEGLRVERLLRAAYESSLKATKLSV